MRTIFQKAKKISGQNMKNAKNRFKKSFSFLGIQQFEIEISVEIISPLWFWALLNGFLLFPNSMGLNNKHMCWLSIELFQRPQPDPYLAWTINQALSVKGWSKGIELAMNQGVTPRPRSRFQGKGHRVQYLHFSNDLYWGGEMSLLLSDWKDRDFCSVLLQIVLLQRC